MVNKFIRINTVIAMTGKSRSSIYAEMAIGNFPKSILIGARSVAWAESDIAAWMKAKVDSVHQLANTPIALSDDELLKQAAAIKAKRETESI